MCDDRVIENPNQVLGVCLDSSEEELSIRRAEELDEEMNKDLMPDRYFISDQGLYFIPPTANGKVLDPIWLSAPIRVVAISRDSKNECFGKIVEFHDPDLKKHEHTVPMELLAGDRKELRGILMSLGLDITSIASARAYFLRYLQICKPRARARSIQMTGWNGFNCFVLPYIIIGKERNEKILFQSIGGVIPNEKIKVTNSDLM